MLGKITKLVDLWDEDEIQEYRKEYAGNSLYAARTFVDGLGVSMISAAAITFRSENRTAPMLKVVNLEGDLEQHREYTVILADGKIIDFLGADEVVPLAQYIRSLKAHNRHISATPVYQNGKGRVVGMEKLSELL